MTVTLRYDLDSDVTFSLVTLTLIYDLSFNVCEQWSHTILTFALSYDLELERKGAQRGLTDADRGKTVDDGRTDGGADAQRTRSHSVVVIDWHNFFGHDVSHHTNYGCPYTRYCICPHTQTLTCIIPE